MKHAQAIILAGGLGKRLKGVVGELPKPMAPVAGKPFLEYVLERLVAWGFEKAVLSVGYLHEKISSYFGSNFGSLQLFYEVEDKPLFTGGGVLVSTKHITAAKFFVLNGDTIFDVDLEAMEKQHAVTESDITIAVKKMYGFDRYGTVEFGTDYRINAFHEKQRIEEGYINGGVYLMNAGMLEKSGLQGKFSLEKDYFEKRLETVNMIAFESEGYFIDIGIPEDYQRAQYELNGIENR